MAESTQQFRAKARWVRCSPQKARLVLDLIKGRRVEDALNTLAFTKKRIAERVEKLLRSAVENVNYLSAEKGLDIDVDNLYVKNAIANDGPRLKRIRPAPQGRAFRFHRRMSHIEIELAEKVRGDASALRKAANDLAGKAAPKAAGKTAGKPAIKKAAKKSPVKKAAGKK